ncbi:MAG: NADP-dependent phosphogluconate dehydrogenase, partial [Flavobacteriaceae bacterium]|nr:NADP-dependent phosphogluconate dehydrogenase [Flavobacteriaceae bacterium]
MSKSEFGIIGLGVMGRSLAKNLLGKGVKLSVYNRAEDNLVTPFLSDLNSEHIQGFTQLDKFVESLETPRKILLMVTAGEVVDMVINQLLKKLKEGDIIIDGGNSHYKDTLRRIQYLKVDQLHYIGLGVSGGEQGALHGPSLMAGGDSAAYRLIAPFLSLLAAPDKMDEPCTTLVGPEGSGHFVKMIHNGIEYAEMQLLAELYA